MCPRFRDGPPFVPFPVEINSKLKLILQTPDIGCVVPFKTHTKRGDMSNILPSLAVAPSEGVPDGGSDSAGCLTTKCKVCPFSKSKRTSSYQLY